MKNGVCVPKRVHTVIISIQHSDEITLKDLRQEVYLKIIKPMIPAHYLDDDLIYHINPCGEFIIGGPQVTITTCKLLHRTH